MATPTTTFPLIRNQWIAVIESLTPGFRSEGFSLFTESPGTFREWAESAKGACFRKFMVRRRGERALPNVTDNGKERAGEPVEAELVVAYPRSFAGFNRANRREVLDIEDVVDADAEKISAAIGIPGVANYLDGESWCGATYETEDGEECVFLVVDLKVVFTRAITPVGDAMQTSAQQTFPFTTTVESDRQPITIPYAMADATYNVVAIRAQADAYRGMVIEADTDTLTVSGFTAQCAGTLPIGAVLDVTIIDRSGS